MNHGFKNKIKSRLYEQLAINLNERFESELNDEGLEQTPIGDQNPFPIWNPFVLTPGSPSGNWWEHIDPEVLQWYIQQFAHDYYERHGRWPWPSDNTMPPQIDQHSWFDWFRRNSKRFQRTYNPFLQ